MIKDEMDRIYRNVPPDRIPWNTEEPPVVLRTLVETDRVRPCRAIELGCGAGHYVIYLASRGFDAVGVDISDAAIGMAVANAARKGVRCRFVAADALGDLNAIRDMFDFAYDWEFLHHVFPPERGKYVRNVHRLLGPGGRYLSVCFSEDDPQFGGAGKYRRTSLGTVLYFSSEKELAGLFEGLFEIEELATIDVEGKTASHKAVYAFMKKREGTAGKRSA